MDQGLVALVTAGVGLVGAIGGAAIGGVAAARGARIGAETAARATARQVRDQAVVDHMHWLRERRLEASRDFLGAYDECLDVGLAFARSLAGNPDRSDVPDPEALFPSESALGRSYFLIRIIGPDALRDAAQQVRQAHTDHLEHLLDWRSAYLRGNDQGVHDSRARQRTSEDQMTAAYTVFVSSANRAMSAPAVSD